MARPSCIKIRRPTVLTTKRGGRPRPLEPRLGLCSDPRHVHCVTCGCPVIVLPGELRRVDCLRCLERGLPSGSPSPSDFASVCALGWLF